MGVERREDRLLGGLRLGASSSSPPGAVTGARRTCLPGPSPAPPCGLEAPVALGSCERKAVSLPRR